MTKTPYNSVSDERLEQLIHWLQSNGVTYERLTSASGDAGFRRYFRVHTQKETLIAVDAPPERENTERFIKIANLLRESGLNTPGVHCYSLENGFMLLDDFGSSHFQAVINASDFNNNCNGNRGAEPLYHRAMDALIQMQNRLEIRGLDLYDRPFLERELELYPTWYLQRHLGYEIGPDQLEIINNAFEILISSALAQPVVFVHRDYHCRNLMVIADDEIGIIDFQDAVAGPVTYDPVSLLRDAYIEWPGEFQNLFIEQHRNSLCPVPDRSTYQRWFDLMGLQRQLKILGIFCRLHYRDSKPHYLADLPLVRRHIQRTLECYPELADFAALFNQLQHPKGSA